MSRVKATLFDRIADEHFEPFWSAYPRKVGKPVARQAYVRALQKPGVTPDILFQGVKVYTEVAQLKEARFVLHPSTWLNQERWADDLDFERKAVDGSGTLAPHTWGDERQDRVRGYWEAAQELLANGK
jgi:hypothetical protein